MFASSGGEMAVLDQLCRALTTPDRALSPTLFHQSVHNTAAGYWGIATGCQQSSTALSSYDDSSALGLLEAVAYATVEERPVLFVAYDLPSPHRSTRARPIRSAFAAALVMTPSASGAPVHADLTLATTPRPRSPGWRIKRWKNSGVVILPLGCCRCFVRLHSQVRIARV